jgi:NTP pyrophosphatase (non-canonical NTP hydrolase)
MSGHLNALAQQIHDTADAHGFWPDEGRNFGEMLMLATSELAEALEEHRDGKPPVYHDTATGKPEGTAVELADCVIRCLDTLHSLGVDIDAVVAEKMAYNASRPYKHGRGY